MRSKGKMYITDEPTGHFLVIADNPGQSGEKNDTRNDKNVARMAQEMESLREEYLWTGASSRDDAPTTTLFSFTRLDP